MIIYQMQQWAMVRARESGEIFCLIQDVDGSIAIFPENEVIARGRNCVDAIVWSTAFAEDALIDPVLRA
ncbi:hypothetical protein CAF53_20620 [Sphingobium sp. LB126]|uniref:hypothetical protein n=1 Tax=unclassified Sphingobium TaxID=2611147 RepID=UPI000C20C369|nr:hypothetical protein [Sphingobium sp. LB126]PJG46560.1 hypothetical protein CAF53_20620 [Sphingobium sp. LB126]